MLLRDKCRKQKKFVEYKLQRNRVNYLVREAKKKIFNDLAGNKADISSMRRAINTPTKGHSPANNNLPSELKPDVFNAHFVSVVSKFLPEDQTDGSQYNCPDRLLNFCRDRISQNTTFSIPPISVFEVGYVWPKPNTVSQNQIGSGLVFPQYDPGPSVDERYTDPESGKVVAGRLRSARTRPDETCTPACFRTRCAFPKNLTKPSRSDLDRFSTI